MQPQVGIVLFGRKSCRSARRAAYQIFVMFVFVTSPGPCFGCRTQAQAGGLAPGPGSLTPTAEASDSHSTIQLIDLYFLNAFIFKFGINF